MYPSVNGRTLSVHGERLVTRPAPKITAKLQKPRKKKMTRYRTSTTKELQIQRGKQGKEPSKTES